MLDYKGMFLSVLTNPSNYDRVCQVYESALQRLLRCPKEEVEAPTGIIALLRYVCDVRHDVIKEFGECMSNVEKIFLPKCQKGCTHPEILTSSGKDNLNMSCVLVHCSTICLDRQISECGDDIRLENIYSLLSGATMLLGVESSLRNNVPTEEMMFAYNNIPRKCKKMMDDSERMLDLAANNVIFEVLADKKIAVISHCDEGQAQGPAVYGNEAENLIVSEKIALAKNVNEDDEPFIVFNLDTVVKKYFEFKALLPRVHPFYAVKCNNDPVLMKVLSLLGTGFDCASKAEIDEVVLPQLANPDDIIYANPCKTKSFITHAFKRGVNRMTFDHEEELIKIAGVHDNPEMILRIAVSDKTAQCPLNLKFGCDPETQAPQLIEKAWKMGLRLVGISFHVGSGCNDPTAYKIAIAFAKDLFEYGNAIGHQMKILDLGGGFPGDFRSKTSFATIAAVIQPALDLYFPEEMGVRIIAEPGRYFAAAPATVTANVIAVNKVAASRITQHEEDSTVDGYMYFLNDGLYGSFNSILFDHQSSFGVPLFKESDEIKHPTTIWGPTCDSLDQIEKVTYMPKLDEGDWIHYANMGAYTSAAASTFNGFQKPLTYYIISSGTWKMLNRHY
uniref:Ornithine decarboxylase n=1 Tax=Rhabditophanes sp. KR3021 TaxID=114890 RepID=A0AC35TL16_9BILA